MARLKTLSLSDERWIQIRDVIIRENKKLSKEKNNTGHFAELSIIQQRENRKNIESINAILFPL